MVQGPRSAPPVTIRDPSRPYGAAQVLQDGEEPPSRADSTRHRRLVPAAVLLLVVALIAGGVVGHRRNLAALEERRLAGIVALSAEHAGSRTRYYPASETSHVEIGVRLLNEGPREVAVVGAEVAGLALRSPVRLGPGAQTRLLLQGTVRCPTRILDPRTTLELQVRTQAGFRRSDVPLTAPLDEVLAEGCGFGAAAQRVSLGLVSATRVGSSLRLVLDVTTRSARAVQVQAVFLARGLEATALGTSPLHLPAPPPGSAAARTLEVGVTVADCAAAAEAVASRPASVTLALTDAELKVFARSVAYESSLLRSLVDDSCPGEGSRAS